MVIRVNQLLASVNYSCRICAVVEFGCAMMFLIFAGNAVLPAARCGLSFLFVNKQRQTLGA